ncbi:VanZ family protein [uncultured Winogradskyella sp.]|uniref:VanZ family protein n=1 Tax=uncultured Winogradskyella sp. TaxID=395353 RepID=UPI002620F337|nr:VanZ family protein [uncultured Winogradskyella sp.]
MVKKLGLLVTIAYTVLLLVYSLVNISSVPSLGSSFDDKIYHFIAYVGLAFLWITYFKFFHKQHRLKYVFLGVFLFGVLLEMVQHQLNTNRTFDVFDMLANCLGVCFGTLVAVKNTIIKLK